MPSFPTFRHLAAACIAAASGSGAQAQNVTLNGSLGSKMALLVIDGAPRTLSVGQSMHGVKLLAVDEGSARVEVEGKQLLLRIGAAPARVGPVGKDGAATEVVLTAGPGGHFVSGGSINGRAVQFLVDTGATVVAIGQGEAEKIGLAYRNAPRAVSNTANGRVVVHRVMLDSIRLGDVEIYNVEAIVMPAQMEHVLLGNSFLTRFQMKRENDRMTLSKRM